MLNHNLDVSICRRIVLSDGRRKAWHRCPHSSAARPAHWRRSAGPAAAGRGGGRGWHPVPTGGTAIISSVDHSDDTLCYICGWYWCSQAVPIPDIPHDSSLTFELIMFAYVAAALGLQYLNLYRWHTEEKYLPLHQKYLCSDQKICVQICVVAPPQLQQPGHELLPDRRADHCLLAGGARQEAHLAPAQAPHHHPAASLSSGQVGSTKILVVSAK